MIILIPIERKSSTNHFDTIGRFRNPEDEGIHFCILRVRQERKYRAVLVVRCFQGEHENQRYLVSEVLNTNDSCESVDTFNQARIPKIVSELTQDWTCEYVNLSHDLFTWRTKMGENYDEELDKDLMLQVFGRGDFVGLAQRLEGCWVAEPYAKEENSPLTQNETSVNMEFKDSTAFSDYITSEEWKHDDI